MREQVIHLLTEAAEIEHNLLCSYLYAAFSLKRENEGLGAEEAAAVARWRSSVMSVASEEMAHLALVNNLLVAIGGAPHFDRPNFPVPPGYHPAGFTARLTPFDEETLEHFLFLERPSEAPIPDGAKFVEHAPERVAPPTRITPSSEDYDTIGEFYELVERELRALHRRHGSAAFAGPGASRQLGPEIVRLPGLRVIAGLDDALCALRTIVEQGEGALHDATNSHFARFSAVQREWRELKARNPRFLPHHPAAHDPVMRTPATAEERVWITAPRARATLDLANAVYGALLTVLCQLYEPSEDATRKALADCAMSLMSACSTLGEALARLPASPQHPGVNAGLAFTSPRNVRARASVGLVVERLHQLSHAYRQVTGGETPIRVPQVLLATAPAEVTRP